MSSLALLGAVWALFGVPMVVRGVNDRRELPMEEFQRAMGALQGSAASTDGPMATDFRTTARRRTVSILMYAPGLVLVALGAAMQDTGVLTVAVAMLNLGTAHRLIGVAVDRSRRRPRAVASIPPLMHLPPAPLGAEPPFQPAVDQGAGDGQTWGDGWQIVGTEPRGVRDLVLVDADVT